MSPLQVPRYVGEVNRFKRTYPDVLIRGTFRDTVGAAVRGECLYSVLAGAGRSRALVLRNPHPRPVSVRAAMPAVGGLRLLLWRPFAKQRKLARLPVRVRLRPYEAAVVLALE